MLPPAHYSAGLATGLTVTKATGSPGLGLTAAILTHLPLDWLVNEYWDWREGEREAMVMTTFPLVFMLVITTIYLSLRGGSWPIDWTGRGLGWWPLLWGLGGLTMDAIDTLISLATRNTIFRRKRTVEGTKVKVSVLINGLELFPCHYRSPIYWGQLGKMLSFAATLASEYAVSLPLIAVSSLIL